jgi:hypothetical protein
MTLTAAAPEKRRPLFKIFMWLAIPPVLLAGFFVACFGVPLLPSSAMTVTYSVKGTTFHDGEVLKPLGMGEATYLHLQHSSKPLYRWLMIRKPAQRVLVPISVRKTWGDLRYVHGDQIIGIDILGGKVDDGWQAQWSGHSVRFYNAEMTVEATFAD